MRDGTIHFLSVIWLCWLRGTFLPESVSATVGVGSLHRLLSALTDSYINVDYIYLSFNRNTSQPILIMHVKDDDIFEVESCLRAKGFTAV